MNIQKQVTYNAPTIRRTSLGEKPAFEFNQNDKVSVDYVKVDQATHLSGPTQTVWGDVPDKSSDGTPALHPVTETLDLTPRSPLKYGLIAGGIGAAVGALGGAMAHGGMGALIGGLGLGAVAGGGAALAVRNDQVKIQWNTHQIADHKLLGYHEYVGIGERNGQRGYFHRFVPDVQETVIGSYTTPEVVHYKKAEEKKP